MQREQRVEKTSYNPNDLKCDDGDYMYSRLKKEKAKEQQQADRQTDAESNL